MISVTFNCQKSGVSLFIKTLKTLAKLT